MNVGYIVSAISLLINIILAIRLFSGDGKKNTSQQTELIIGMKNIEKSVSNIESKFENLSYKVEEDHDAIIRLQENSKQVWKIIGNGVNKHE